MESEKCTVFYKKLIRSRYTKQTSN